jgi:hypothetical protein
VDRQGLVLATLFLGMPATNSGHPKANRFSDVETAK